MIENQQRSIEILQELGANPAVPFHEQSVSNYIKAFISKLGIEMCLDPYGTIITHYQTQSTTEDQPMAFVAHMDHPGFEVIESSKKQIIARGLGGVPVAAFTKPTAVTALVKNVGRIQGMTRPSNNFTKSENGDRLILIDTNQQQSIPAGTPIIFDLPDFEFDDRLIRMRALDDLAGCASILIMLERLVFSQSKANVYGIFTRAEETGLYGARLLASSGILPQNTIIISIESSSVIPGVSQGEGPVIRTGDASTTFDFQAEYFLKSAAIRLKNKRGKFDVQRQLMNGGTCEATAFSSMGYRSTGIAFPLGNYHNATTTIRDPEGNVDAEYITLSDYLDGIELAFETSLGSTCSTEINNKGWDLGPVPLDIKNRLQSSFQP